MSLTLYKALAALFIFVIAIAMTLPAIIKRHAPHHSEWLELGDAFASGVFLGAALLHLLPDAQHAFASWSGYPWPEFICALGFLSLLLLERLSLSFENTKESIPYILALTLMIHALIEGGALGISPTFTETSTLLIAIAAHKGAESLALGLLLIRHQLSLQRIIYLVLLFTLMTPLGIAGGTWLSLGSHHSLIEGIFNAFAAGTFLYISTLHHGHFHEHTDGGQGLLEYTALAAGTLFMSAIALWT